MNRQHTSFGLERSQGYILNNGRYLHGQGAFQGKKIMGRVLITTNGTQHFGFAPWTWRDTPFEKGERQGVSLAVPGVSTSQPAEWTVENNGNTTQLHDVTWTERGRSFVLMERQRVSLVFFFSLLEHKLAFSLLCLLIAREKGIV